MNIAVYGGSFDPPHLGHVMVVAHLLLNDPSIDHVYIIPCFQQSGKDLSPFDHRMIMCQKTFQQLGRTTVLPVEQELGGESLTIRLIQELIRREPEANFRFVMGSDLMDSAPQWDGWNEIVMLAPPLVIGRAGISPLDPGGPTPISPLVSSTIVREALFQRRYREAGRYLTPSVCQYIQAQKLYVRPEDTGVFG